MYGTAISKNFANKRCEDRCNKVCRKRNCNGGSIVEFFGFYDGKLPVEEYVKAPHSGMEELGKEQVSQLVGDNQEGQTDEEY